MHNSIKQGLATLVSALAIFSLAIVFMGFPPSVSFGLMTGGFILGIPVFAVLVLVGAFSLLKK
jgi:hypothetical protein